MKEFAEQKVEKNAVFSFQMTPEFHRNFKRCAQLEGETMRDFLIKAVEDRIAETKRKWGLE